MGWQFAIGTAGTPHAEAGEPGLGKPTTSVIRIRTHTPVVARLIQEATERSATFRRLVETINASDGNVYINEGDCGHGVRACLAQVIAAGPNRIIRVQVDTRKADWDLMGRSE